MAWVLSAVLVVALVAVAAILGRRITALRRELTAALDLNASARAIPAIPDPSAGFEPVVTHELGKAGSPVEAGSPAGMPATTTDPPAASTAPSDPATDQPPSASPAPTTAATTDPPAESASPDYTLESAPVGDPPASIAPASTDVAPDGRLPSLWALTLLEQQRQWRLGVTAATPLMEHVPDNLPGVLAVEVERIREEVGTPGSLIVEMTPPATVDDDALVFQATRQLLALLVPHTQAFDLVLHRAGDQAVVELTCSGWEGPEHVAEGVGQLLEAVAPAGGDLELDMLPDDRLQATLRLPLH